MERREKEGRKDGEEGRRKGGRMERREKEGRKDGEGGGRREISMDQMS